MIEEPTTTELLKIIRELEVRVKRLEEKEREQRNAYERMRPLW